MLLSMKKKYFGIVTSNPKPRYQACLLGSHIETLLIEHAARAGIARETPLVVHWAVLLESGGMWGLPLIGAILSVRLLAGVKDRIKAIRNHILLRQRYRRMGLG